MIKIKKDINFFGGHLPKGCSIIVPDDITNTGSGVITAFYKDNKTGASASYPIACGDGISYEKSVIGYLNEICRLNTNQTYKEYCDEVNAKEYLKLKKKIN